MLTPERLETLKRHEIYVLQQYCRSFLISVHFRQKKGLAEYIVQNVVPSLLFSLEGHTKMKSEKIVKNILPKK